MTILYFDLLMETLIEPMMKSLMDPMMKPLIESIMEPMMKSLIESMVEPMMFCFRKESRSKFYTKINFLLCQGWLLEIEKKGSHYHFGDFLKVATFKW